MHAQPIELNPTRHSVSRAVLAAGVVLALCSAWPGAAHGQGPGPSAAGVRLDSGLLSFFTGAGRTVMLTVTEVGDPAVASRVRIVYYNAAGEVVVRDEGPLTRRRPYTYELPLDMGEPLVQLRVSVTIVGVRGRGSAPVVAVEAIDPGSFAIEPRVSCAPPASREGPVTPFCPDFVVSSFSAGG